MRAETGGKIWPVGVLCRAVAEQLEARFNPVAVAGEISGLSRAASGHVYFTLKDDAGQIRCAMFKRVVGWIDFVPREGERVEIWGRLDIYPQRGDLQLVVEGMRRVGQGALYEQFLRRKAQLEAEGLFQAGRKRELPRHPRAVGLVTSLSAAALHDVASALQRRAPHVPMYIAPAAVQGDTAAAELVRALLKLYEHIAQGLPLDVILLVRGGGAMEDLWSFNDETLVRTLAASPVPVVTGVGHETDFTLVDFCADLRAPTPTAAAELAVTARQACVDQLLALAQDLRTGLQRRLDRWAQVQDRLAWQLGQASTPLMAQKLGLGTRQEALTRAAWACWAQRAARMSLLQTRLERATQQCQRRAQDRMERAGLRLQLLDPALVLNRGYAWLHTTEAVTVNSVQQVQRGQTLQATLADGTLDLKVLERKSN